MANGTERGSSKLSYTQQQLSQADLEDLARIGERRGVKLVDWCVLGIPHPDGVCGTFQTTPRLASSVLRHLILENPIRLRFDVFPYGIPVRDSVMIDFRSSEPRGGLSTNG